jgi:hypothetical protein
MNVYKFGILAVAGCMMGWAVQHWRATPELHRSWETKECVQVLPIGAGSCKNPPDSYTLVWTR